MILLSGGFVLVRFFIKLFRVKLNIPYKAKLTQGLDDVVRDVDLVPVHALAFAVWAVVMVVVPAFAEGHDGEPPVVTAVVAGVKAAIAKYVGYGVNAEGPVVEKGGADEETPDQHLKTVSSKTRRVLFEQGPDTIDGKRQYDGRNNVVVVQETQFRILCEIRDCRNVCFFVFLTDYPANM